MVQLTLMSFARGSTVLTVPTVSNIFDSKIIKRFFVGHRVNCNKTDSFRSFFLLVSYTLYYTPLYTADVAPLARARSAVLRAKLYGNQMARRLRQASEKASSEIVVPGKNSATKKSQVSLLFQAGNDEDIAMSVNLKVDVPTEEEKAAMGDGTEAQVAITISCKEGTSDIQLGKLVGRIQSLYAIATEHLPEISAFGSLDIAPTELEDGQKGLVLTFSSPNNAIQMMVPKDTLPMDPTSLLDSFEATIGIGICFEDIMSLDEDALFAKFYTVFKAQTEGSLNSDAILHAGEVAATVMHGGSKAKTVARLVANLCMANATLKFDSFDLALVEEVPFGDEMVQNIEEIFFMAKLYKKRMTDFLNTGPNSDGHGVPTGFFTTEKDAYELEGDRRAVQQCESSLNMKGDQIRDMYNDIQSVVSGIYKVEAITTLGFRVVLTLTNFNPIACLVPSLDEIDQFERV